MEDWQRASQDGRSKPLVVRWFIVNLTEVLVFLILYNLHATFLHKNLLSASYIENKHLHRLLSGFCSLGPDCSVNLFFVAKIPHVIFHSYPITFLDWIRYYFIDLTMEKPHDVFECVYWN